MASLEDVRSATADLLGALEGGLDYLSQDLLAEYESHQDDAEVDLTTATIRYGNRVAQIGSCVYWKSSAVGGMCGDVVNHVCFRSVGWSYESKCPAGYWGLKLTIS